MFYCWFNRAWCIKDEIDMTTSNIRKASVSLAYFTTVTADYAK